MYMYVGLYTCVLCTELKGKIILAGHIYKYMTVRMYNVYYNTLCQ